MPAAARPHRLGVVTEKMGDHAVVLGGSIAGLMAARVLAGAFDRVTVVERDSLSAPERKGVPQAHHAHSLLPRGGKIALELFPGLLDRFSADRVPSVEQPAQAWMELSGHRLCLGDIPDDERNYQPSRPCLEGALRDEVRGMPGTDLRDTCTALGLLTSASRDRITGVRVAPHGEDEQEIAADLVVDATGRGGRTPVWLREFGYDAPDEELIPVDVMYTTRHLRLPPEAIGDLRLVLVSAEPGRPAGMALIAQENEHFVLTLYGYSGHHAPTDPDGFLAFAERVAPPHVFAALGHAEWLDEPRRHRYPANRRRYYERLRRFPDGLIVLGDGICSFNPIFGQGMSVAAMQAVALRDTLAGGRKDLARRFFAAAAAPVDQAWQIVAGTDRAMAGLPRRPADRLVGAYVRGLHAAAAHDPVLSDQFFKVSGLIDAPAALFKPNVLLRVLAGNVAAVARKTPLASLF